MKRIGFLLCILAILVACGGKPQPEEVVVKPTLTAEQALGKALYTEQCARCHATVPDVVVVGPSLHGIATQGQARVAGQSAAQYIENSIINPNDFVIEGFDEAMPSTFGKELAGEEIDALVAYLLTFE